MEHQVSHHISLIHNRIKSQRQETCQTKIHSTREHSCVRIIRFMHMATRMILPTSMTCKIKLGQRSDIILKLRINNKKWLIETFQINYIYSHYIFVNNNYVFNNNLIQTLSI